MPISHVSEVIRANPFIQPFDIELMTRVNSYKQEEFYKNAAKAENMVTQLNNADIANPEQREYLKGKVNNLTSQLNNMGAINYSDLNIANTIEGFGSEIYGDDKVLNGIQSTKSIREWQTNVQKLKTDPKLSKYYNGANEAYDLENHIKPYISGGIDAKYEGPRAPKPYMGNPFTLIYDKIKTLKPDIETRIDPVTGNEFFFSKTENRRLTPEDISAAVDGLIDGDTKQQLQIDAWYNYDYTTGNKFDKQLGTTIYTQDLDNKIASKQDQLETVNTQIKAEPDIIEKAKWEQQRNAIQEQLKTYTTQRSTMVKDFAKQFDKDPKGTKYGLYMTRFQRDLIKAAGYDETKQTLIKNEERLFTARQQLEYTKAGLFWDGASYKADGTPLVLPVAGAENMGKKDGTDSKAKVVNPAEGLFHDLTQNTESNKEARAHKITEEVLVADNDRIDLDLTDKMRTFLEKTAKRGGYDLGFVNSPQTNAGSTAVASYSPLLEAIQSIGNQKVLDRSDIEAVIKNSGNNGGIINYNGKQVGVTKDQINFFKNVMKNWDAVATGKLNSDEAPMNISVNDLSAFVDQYQNLTDIKKSNLGYINNIYDQALATSGLTPEQIERYKALKTHQAVGQNLAPVYKGKDLTTDQLKVLGMVEGAGKTLPNGVGISPEIVSLEGKMKNAHLVKQQIKAAFDNASNRDNYYSLYLPGKEVLEKGAPGVMAKIRNNAVAEHGNVENLEPLSITRTAEGEFILAYTFGKDKAPAKGEVKLDPSEAIRLGGQIFPNEPLERLLTYETSTGPRYTYSPVFKQPIKYSIEREGNARNGRTYIPYVYYGDEKIPVFAPDKTGFQGSANAAEQLLKQYITENALTSYEDLIAGLKKLRNQ